MRPRAACLWLAALCFLLGWPAAPASAVTRPAAGEPLPVLVLAGQSNMVGWVTKVNELPPPERGVQTHVLFYGPNENGSTWGWLVPPTVSDGRFGPEISLGQDLVQPGLYDLVAQVKYAAGGTNLAFDWNPANGWFYAQMLLRAQAALQKLQLANPDRRVYVAGFFWMQGEQDALDANMAAHYASNLTGLIAQVRADFNAPALPVFVGRIRAGQLAFANEVRQAQAQVAAAVPNVRLIDRTNCRWPPTCSTTPRPATWNWGRPSRKAIWIGFTSSPLYSCRWSLRTNSRQGAGA